MGRIADFAGKKILVAEDDEMNRALMEDIFQNMGCLFEFAVDGNQVVEKYKQEDFDLILMDIRMPKKDGIQAAREIRAMAKKRVPIIALTASMVDHEKQTCLEAGIDDFIFKPIIIKDLKNKMTRYLYRK